MVDLWARDIFPNSKERCWVVSNTSCITYSNNNKLAFHSKLKQQRPNPAWRKNPGKVIGPL
jgi:hypothetical protein